MQDGTRLEEAGCWWHALEEDILAQALLTTLSILWLPGSDHLFSGSFLMFLLCHGPKSNRSCWPQIKASKFISRKQSRSSPVFAPIFVRVLERSHHHLCGHWHSQKDGTHQWFFFPGACGLQVDFLLSPFLGYVLLSWGLEDLSSLCTLISH